MRHILSTVFVSVLIPGFTVASQAKSVSQAGGLPALEERVAALEAQILALQGGEPSYEGN